MILMEYYYCNSQNYNGSPVNCKGITDNDTFSTKIISPLVSDLYSLRYDSLNTECFRSDKFNIVLQIIGHANNYFNKTSYKIKKYQNDKDEGKIYFYGGVVDIYGNYKSKSKAMVVCLDNSNFFNSPFEDHYRSRAYLSFDSKHDIFKKIRKQEGGNGADATVPAAAPAGAAAATAAHAPAVPAPVVPAPVVPAPATTDPVVDPNDAENPDNDDDKDKDEESQQNNSGTYPEEYLSAFKIHNYIAFYTTPSDIPKAITNATTLNPPITIEADLYTILLQFKQIKQYAHANFYGSTEFNLIMSTVGIEGRARHGMTREDMREIQQDKQDVLDSTIGTRLNKITETRDLSLTSVQKSVKDAVLIQRTIKGDDTFSVNDYINNLKIKKGLHKTAPTTNKPLTSEEIKHLTVQPLPS